MKSRFLALHYPKLTVAAASYSTGAKWGAAGTTAQLSMLHQVGGGDRWKKGGKGRSRLTSRDSKIIQTIVDVSKQQFRHFFIEEMTFYQDVTRQKFNSI